MNELEAGRAADKDPHSRPGRYTTRDLLTTEYEVARGVAEIVRMLKPDLVIETGAHVGTTSSLIGMALEGNADGGHLLSFEIRERFAVEARAACEGLPVTIALGRVQDHRLQAGSVDVVFLDSSENDRPSELEYVWPAVRAGGIILVHDTSVHRAKVVDPVLPMLRLWGARWVELHTPRGLMLIEKPN